MEFVSSLICDTSLSVNTSGRRKYPVTRITIHTADRPDMKLDKFKLFYGAEFENVRDNKNSTIAYSYSQCSYQYGIDADGKIIQLLDERFRSWASSNEDNDNRAITIICSYGYGGDGKTVNSLIDLCVDICKRYNKKKLIWIGDKDKALSYELKEDEMLLTLHRWFSYTACPGDWVVSQLDKWVSVINKKLSEEDNIDNIPDDLKKRMMEEAMKIVTDPNYKGIKDEEEEEKDYFHDVRYMKPENGCFCSCCRREVDEVRMYIWQKENDLTTRQYFAICKDCRDAICRDWLNES